MRIIVAYELPLCNANKIERVDAIEFDAFQFRTTPYTSHFNNMLCESILLTDDLTDIKDIDISMESATFDYIWNSNTRLWVRDAYQVITQKEWWTEFKYALETRGVDENTGFMFTSDPVYSKIMHAISNTPVGQTHSGCSLALCMRELKFIALHGEPEYRKRYV